MDFGKGTNEEGFWAKGDFEKRFPGVENPWNGADASAPYDQKFYVVMNVAVGGVSGFFPDGLVRGGYWGGGEWRQANVRLDRDKDMGIDRQRRTQGE